MPTKRPSIAGIPKETHQRLLASYFSDTADDTASCACEMEQVAESFFRTVSSASDSDKKPAERIFRNEKKWNKFFSVDLLDALPDLQSDLSGNEESVSLEQYIFFIERSLARTVMNKNPLFAADLLCRKPLIFFGFEKQLAANISSDALPRSYYTMLAHSLASFVAELVDFPMDQRIVLFLRAVRSPYRAACDFAERERNSHLFFLRGKAKFYDILVDSTIAELKLEKRHYTSKLYPDGRMAVAPFAELTLEALALLRARHHSESFFRSLPQRLLTSLESSDSRLAAKLKDDPGPQFFENPGLVSFEFPEQQSLHMLRAKAIGLRLAYEQVSAKDNVADAPDLLRRDLAETLTLLQFSAAQAYRECLWDIERAQSVCSLLPQLEQSQPNLKDRLREEFLLASQDQERSIIRKSELEAYLTSIPEELFRLHKSALPDAKTAHSSELHLTKESIMDSLLLQQSLLRIIDQSGTTLAAFGKEKRTNTLLDALTSAAAELLPALKDELTRILKPLAVKDPFSASKLDVPDPFGATVQRFAAALKNEEQSTLLKKHPYAERVILTAAILSAYHDGADWPSLRRSFPVHLVDAVVIRLLLAQSENSAESLKAKHPEHTALIALVEQLTEVEDFLSSGCREAAKVYRILCGKIFQSKAKTTGLEKRIISNAALLFVLEWYFSLAIPLCMPPAVSVKSPEQAALDRESFSLWLRRFTALRMEEEEPHLFAQILEARPSLVFTAEELGDFNSSYTDERQHYLSALLRAFSQQAMRANYEELLNCLGELFICIRSPYRDFFEENQYPLTTFIDSKFSLDPMQRRLFSAEMRQEMLRFWVFEQELLFYGGQEQIGQFAGLFLDQMEKETPELLKSLQLENLNKQINSLTESIHRQAPKSSPAAMIRTLGENERRLLWLDSLRTMLERDTIVH